MTFEPGDIVRDRLSGSTFKVLAVHEESGRVWGMPEGEGNPLTYLVEQFIKVEPFFEVGKKYFHKQLPYTFEPVRVDTESNGEKVAYGEVTYADTGNSYWETKRVFGGWTETEAEEF